MKLVKEYIPDNIMLSKDSWNIVLNTYKNKTDAEQKLESNKTMTITFMLALIGALISVVGAYNSVGNVWKVVLCGLALIMIVGSIVFAIRWYESNKEVDKLKVIKVDDILNDKIRENVRYTAIIRIFTENKGKHLYLVDKDNVFLPHCTMSKDKTIDEQENNIRKGLFDDFSIESKHILKIAPITQDVYCSIKPIHDTVSMNVFAFYDVEINIAARKKLLQENSNRKWMTLDAMRKDITAVSNNIDVINILATLPKPKESFVSILGDINLIWNITSQCQHNCEICATADSKRNELGADKMLTVFNNISSAKDKLKSIDFAGGDPFINDSTMEIIRTAIGVFGPDKISVTTTGKGIEYLAKSNFSFTEKIDHCEITIDAAHSNLSKNITREGIERKEEKYCSMNEEQIVALLEYTDSLTINIPIINDDLSDEEIECLSDKIKRIRTHNSNVTIDTLLIRLMPVGRLAEKYNKDMYKQYNPIEVAKKIKTKFNKEGIPCRYHCSLRVLHSINEPNGCNYCSMLERKLGIDCEGNVFACAWGGYLQIQDVVENNPFYLGNLTKTSLIDILQGENKTAAYKNIIAEINSKQQRDFCSVVSYYEKQKLFENYDYLAKQRMTKNSK